MSTMAPLGTSNCVNFTLPIFTLMVVGSVRLVPKLLRLSCRICCEAITGVRAGPIHH